MSSVDEIIDQDDGAVKTHPRVAIIHIGDRNFTVYDQLQHQAGQTCALDAVIFGLWGIFSRDTNGIQRKVELRSNVLFRLLESEVYLKSHVLFAIHKKMLESFIREETRNEALMKSLIEALTLGKIHDSTFGFSTHPQSYFSSDSDWDDDATVLASILDVPPQNIKEKSLFDEMIRMSNEMKSFEQYPGYITRIVPHIFEFVRSGGKIKYIFNAESNCVRFRIIRIDTFGKIRGIYELDNTIEVGITEHISEEDIEDMDVLQKPVSVETDGSLTVTIPIMFDSKHEHYMTMFFDIIEIAKSSQSVEEESRDQ